MSAPDKLYIISRSDLPPGLQAAQAAHAAFEFALRHPDVMRKWHEDSSYLILLSVPDEDALLDVLDVLAYDPTSPAYAYMVEPDIGNEHTAVAIGPHPINVRWSSLPLMGKELAMT